MALMDLFRKRASDPQLNAAAMMAEAIRAENARKGENLQAVHEGPFPLFDVEGRLVCKSCGIAFNAEPAAVVIADAQKKHGGMDVLMLNCSKCRTLNLFNPDELRRR